MEFKNCHSRIEEEDTFRCGKCKAEFISLDLFLAHKRNNCKFDTIVQQPAVSNVDKIDQTSTLHQDNLIQLKHPYTNINDCDEAPKVYCTICSKPFKKYKSLEVHRKIHTGERGFQCPVCGRCFIQSSHLQRHLQSHRVWPSGLIDTTPKTTSVELLSYACLYCDAVLAKYSQFRVHLKIHTSLKKFKCIQSNCVNLYNDIETLLEHVSVDHMHTSYQCHMCTTAFTSLTDIAIHQQEHNQKVNKIKMKLKCAHCDASFRSKTTLSLHLSTNSHNRTCIHCKKTFASDKRLRHHLQIHREEKPFSCNVCGQSFHMKGYLTSHMLKHGDRLHTCTICNFKFKRRDLLIRHQKTHQKTNKLQCPFKDNLGCIMEFTRTDKLKLHIKHHKNRMTAIPKPQVKEASTLELLIVPMSKDNFNIL